MKKVFTLFLICTSLIVNGDSWVIKSSIPGSARVWPFSFTIKDKAYVGCGRTFNGASQYDLKDCWEYNPSNDTWTQKADFGGTAREGATGFSINNKGYICGGYDYAASVCTVDCWQYDPDSNKWFQKANFGFKKRYLAAGFAINNKEYIGNGGCTLSNDFWVYDSTDYWKQLANSDGPIRSGAFAFSINGKGYLSMGQIPGGYGADIWEYDPIALTWTQKAIFPGYNRGYGGGFSIGTKGYIGVGKDATNNYQDFWMFDPVQNTWTQKTDFPTPRYGVVSFSVGGKGYMGMGFGGNWEFDLWEYTPDITDGINEINSSIGISISPNPLISSSTLQLSTPLKNAEVIIYDMLGHEMMRKKMNGVRMEIERGSLVSGVYFVKVGEEERQCVEKIVVE